MAAAPPSATSPASISTRSTPSWAASRDTSSPTAGDENAAVRVANPSAISSSRASDSRAAAAGDVLRVHDGRDDQLPCGIACGERLRETEERVERVGFGWCEEQRALGRWSGLRGPHSPGIVRRRQIRVLPEDRRLELLQRLARLEAQLVGELAPGLAVRLERLGLALAAVEREHQLVPEPLPQRMRGHERLELRHQLGVAAEREVGLDTQLERAEPQLLQPRDLGLSELLVGQVGQRRPAPQRECLAQLRADAVSGEARRASATSCSKRARSSSAASTYRT